MFGRKGESSPNFGRKASEETRRKISETRTGKPLSEIHRKALLKARIGNMNRRDEKKDN
jgi:hypothetical protein